MAADILLYQTDLVPVGNDQIKNELADVIAETLGPIKKKYQEVCKESSLVESLLKKGSLKARTIAETMLRLVNESRGSGSSNQVNNIV